MSRSARDEILSKIAAASTRGVEGSPGTLGRESFAGIVAQIKSNCEQNRAELITQFETELSRVGARLYYASNAEAARDRIRDLALDSLDAKSAVAWGHQIVRELGVFQSLESAGVTLFSDDREGRPGEFIEKAAEAQIGISGVDYALADTGTIVLLSGEGRARSASLLPPIHIALLRPEQIVSGLDDLFSLLKWEAAPSAVTFITGPSRTGDIEMTLVVGVHGPQQLHVILVAAEAT